jgi:hypothetical protein
LLGRVSLSRSPPSAVCTPPGDEAEAASDHDQRTKQAATALQEEGGALAATAREPRPSRE